ncbi:MAG: hypothetical protein FJ265_13205 [Planctomycetes bacterium]|nr:hypothetical protein [Planctomycetota bacterium]
MRITNLRRARGAALALLAACAAPPAPAPLRAGLDGSDPAAFAAIAEAFAAANPGCSLAWLPAAREVGPAAGARIGLVQHGAGRVRIERAAGAVQADVGAGDALVLGPGERASFAAPVGLLVFGVPASPSALLPRAIRPDHDPRLTDTPGGCATDGAVYRRMLLTWRAANGPYTFHGLNVHRVRIDDSFTHYHPRDGGFDEFYLVQATRDGARLLTTARVDAIERRAIGRAEVEHLFATLPLRAGDLVYLPRGLAHRALGGALVQVITVPGFVPGAEIGLDHHLRAINERLGLAGDAALPLHAAAAAGPVVR